MDTDNLTERDLEEISRLQAKKELETGVTERPKSQRILALVFAGIVVLGVILTCYWLMTPPV